MSTFVGKIVIQFMESWVCIYSLVFEHLTANQDIPGLNLRSPLFMNFLAITFLKIFFQTKSFAGLLLLFFRLIFSGLFRFSNKMFCFSYFVCEMVIWGCSSVVEHSIADWEVPGSNPGVPYICVFVRNCTSITGYVFYTQPYLWLFLIFFNL